MTQPEWTVEIGFGWGWRDPLPDVTWTDVTAYVEGAQPVTTNRGRSDEFSEIQPSKFQVTLDNSDGRFTPTNAASPYFPDVQASVPIRLTATFDGEDYHRFTGYVEGWPVAWPDGADTSSSVTVTATASFPRLVFATLDALTTMEQLEKEPIALFPLDEPAVPGGPTEDLPTIARDRMGNTTDVYNLPLLNFQNITGDTFDDDGITTPTDDAGGSSSGSFDPNSSNLPLVYPATRPVWPETPLFNLCANPAFEVDTSWHFGVNATLTTSTTQAWNGTRSLRAQATGAGTMIVRADYGGNDLSEITPGVPVFATVRVRAGATARSVKLEAIARKTPGGIRYTNQTDTDPSGAGPYDRIILGTVTNDSTSAWTEYSVTFTPAVDEFYFALQLTFTGCAASELHYIDGEQAFAGADHTYFDGDTAGYAWTGKIGGSVACEDSLPTLVTTDDPGFTLELCQTVGVGELTVGAGAFFTMCGLRDINGSPVFPGQFAQQILNGLVDGFEFGFLGLNSNLGFTRRRNNSVTTTDTGIEGLLDVEVVIDPDTLVETPIPRFLHLALTLTRGASTSVVRIYVNSELAYTSAAFTNIDTNWNEFFVQGWTGTNLNSEGAIDGASVAHVGLYNKVLTAQEIADIYEAASDGWTDEDTAQRFGRYAEYADLEYSTQGRGLAYSMPLLMTNGRNALTVLRTFENAERGLLIEDGAGGLIFQTRSVRPESTVAISLSVADQEVEAQFAPTFDKFGMLNDYTVTSSYDPGIPPGVSKDLVSDHAYGPYPGTDSLHLSDPAELQGAADLTVAARKDPHFRVPSITVDVTNASDDQTTALLALDVSSRLELTDLPAQAPASTLEFFVEAINESIGFTYHWITFTLSPAETQFGWVLDSATESVLDTTTIPI